jgi:hypothetical protein
MLSAVTRKGQVALRHSRCLRQNAVGADLLRLLSEERRPRFPGFLVPGVIRSRHGRERRGPPRYNADINAATMACAFGPGNPVRLRLGQAHHQHGRQEHDRRMQWRLLGRVGICRLAIRDGIESSRLSAGILGMAQSSEWHHRWLHWDEGRLATGALTWRGLWAPPGRLRPRTGA